jgi:hypothetical protein
MPCHFRPLNTPLTRKFRAASKAVARYSLACFRPSRASTPRLPLSDIRLQPGEQIPGHLRPVGLVQHFVSPVVAYSGSCANP